MSRAREFSALILAALALAACTNQSASTPAQAPRTTTLPGQSATVTPDNSDPTPEPSLTWQSKLKPKADTFYLGQGELPTVVVDKTKASSSGRLVLRVECDKGKFAPSITVDGASQPSAVTCDETTQEKFLTDIRKGQEVVIHGEGDEGTQFAMELVIRQDVDHS